jgi:hypothetical protein
MELSSTESRKSRWIKRVAEGSILAFCFVVLGFLTGFLSFGTYQPPRGLKTLDQLAAHLPETLKFAVVTSDDRSFVVWIGRSRGVIVSGPPVYVFDQAGTLVDHVGDAGDSNNAFVGKLYGEAFQAAAISTDEAVAYCSRH